MTNLFGMVAAIVVVAGFALMIGAAILGYVLLRGKRTQPGGFEVVPLQANAGKPAQSEPVS